MKKNVLLTVFLLWIPILIYSQWIQTDGPYGKTSVPVIFENNSKLYVGTNCGLHKNDNLIGDWKYFANIDIDVYDKKGDSIFYSGSPNGVNLIILSDDNPVPISLGLSSKINTIKSSETCLLAGVKGGGFAKSNGFSNSWIYYNDGLPVYTVVLPGGGTYDVRFVYSIEIVGNKILCGTDRGVYSSDITNISWTESSNGLPKEPVGLLKVLDDTIFTSIDDDLYYSSDNGNSWSELYTFPSSITSIEKFSGIFYITTISNGIFKSTNLSSWTDFNSGLSDLNIKTIKLIDSVLVCGTSRAGIHYMKNNNWAPNNSGIICSSIRSLVTSNNKLIANNAENVYLSSNKNNWNDISPNVDRKYFGSLVTMGDTIFLSYQNNSKDRLINYYSVENDSWENVINIPPYEGDDAYRMLVDGNVLYAYEDDQMYYTSDLGAYWTGISLPSHYCNMFYDFLIYNSQPFAATCGNDELVKLSNNSWELTNSGLSTGGEIVTLAHSSDALYVHVRTEGIFVSKNNGESWSEATNGLGTDSRDRVRSFAYQDKNIFVTTQKGVYYSDNYGRNWNELNDGLINVDTGEIVILNDTLYVGTYGNGIWKHDIESIPLSISESSTNDNLDFYPNPASNDINIVLPIYQNGEIQIFDLMGRNVLSKKLYKSGNIDVSNISNGTYILSLRLNDKIKTSKLIISR